MRVILMHNPTAGHQSHSRDGLTELLEDAGYDPSYQSTDDDDYPEALKDHHDLVVVAGGDGTVSKVGAHLLDRDVSMAILPTGTANNIAHALGMLESVPAIVQGLSVAPRVGYDVGLASGPWGEAPIFEGIGVGLFPHVMNVQEKRRKKDKLDEDSGQEELRNDLLALIEHTGSFPGIDLTVTIDDREVSGKFLLAEIMNIGYVGPHLLLAPEGSTRDGYADVLLVEEKQRDAFVEYLSGRLVGDKSAPGLPVERGKHIHLSLNDPDATWEDYEVRIDGKVWPRKNPHGLQDLKQPIDPREIDVKMQKHALQFLVTI